MGGSISVVALQDERVGNSHGAGGVTSAPSVETECRTVLGSYTSGFPSSAWPIEGTVGPLAPVIAAA